MAWVPSQLHVRNNGFTWDVGCPHWVIIGLGYYAMVWQGAIGYRIIKIGKICIHDRLDDWSLDWIVCVWILCLVGFPIVAHVLVRTYA